MYAHPGDKAECVTTISTFPQKQPKIHIPDQEFCGLFSVVCTTIPSAAAYRCNVSSVGFGVESFSSRESTDRRKPERESTSANDNPSRSRSARKRLTASSTSRRIASHACLATRPSRRISSRSASASRRAIVNRFPLASSLESCVLLCDVDYSSTSYAVTGRTSILSGSVYSNTHARNFPVLVGPNTIRRYSVLTNVLDQS